MRENQAPKVKHGTPRSWNLDELSPKILYKEDLLEYIDLIEEYAESDDDTFFEEQNELYSIIQLSKYRIVTTYPPLSDALEITIVRPTISRSLQDYNLDRMVWNRLESQADGILIAGAPGQGKSTFASALANFYADKSKIVKTIEKPRDLQLEDNITQFTIIQKDVEKLGDLLLLMRPDYVIYDEIRKNSDFEIYSDMRLSGVGMVGVIHATQAIDSIQRFVNRIDLGLIPSIIDTVIFIKNGEVDTVLSLKIIVKTPHGFTDHSLARPVIEVRELISKIPLYEIFSFGEQVVVIPIKKKGNFTKKANFNPKEIVNILTRNFYGLYSKDIDIDRKGRDLIRIGVPSEFKLQIEEDEEVIQQLETMNNTSITIFELNDYSLNYKVYFSKKNLVIALEKKHANSRVNLMIGPQHIMRADVNGFGELILSRKRATTRRLENFMEKSDEKLFITKNS